MPLRTQLDEQPALNLTSMIDVLFLLIIFFMAGTRFTAVEKKIGLKLPQVTDGGALVTAPEKKTINIDRTGQITLDRDIVSVEELARRLAAARNQYPDLGVLIRGDGQGAFEPVAEALNACRKAGIVDTGIAVTTEPLRR